MNPRTHTPARTSQPRFDTATIPSARLYFAILPAPSIGNASGARTREAMLFHFEEFVPAPLHIHQVILRPIDNNCWLACAAPVELVVPLHASGIASLTPDDLPAFVKAAAPLLTPSDLNLLVGAYEPIPLRSARRSVFTRVCVATVLIAALLISGLELRRWHALAAAGRAISQSQDRIDTVLPSKGATPEPAAARLTAALRTARERQRLLAASPPERNAAQSLAGLLTAWPKDLRTQTSSLSVTATGISLVVLVPDQASVAKLAGLAEGIPGWKPSPAQTATGERGITATMQWAPSTEDRP